MRHPADTPPDACQRIPVHALGHGRVVHVPPLSGGPRSPEPDGRAGRRSARYPPRRGPRRRHARGDRDLPGSADAAPWIRNVVAERCPNAKLCLDPFHLVQMGTRALDDVRRSVWNGLRRAGDRRGAEALKGARWALWKNHDDLDDNQAATLARIEHTNKPLFRAYLLKEELRSIFQEADPNEAKRTFKAWLAWASRSRLPPFVKLARSLRTHRDAIHRRARASTVECTTRGRRHQAPPADPAGLRLSLAPPPRRPRPAPTRRSLPTSACSGVTHEEVRRAVFILGRRPRRACCR